MVAHLWRFRVSTSVLSLGLACAPLRRAGLEDTAANRSRLLAAYLRHLPGCLARLRGRVLPGVVGMLERLRARGDVAIGLHEAVGYYYYPAFHEPGSGFSLGINRAVWESLAADDRRVIEALAAAEYARSLAQFNANNAASLRKLRDLGGVKILKFDDSLLKALLAVSHDVVAGVGARDELSRRIYASYQRFRGAIMDWSDVAERAYLDSRRLG